MVRAAAKNFRDVLVVVDPADYPRLLAALDRRRRASAFRFELMRKAFAHTAAYDTAIAATLRDDHASTAIASSGDARRRAGAASPIASTCRSRRSAICATARTRTSRRRGIGRLGGVGARRPRRRRRSCRARSCRTRTCSISTRPRASRSSSTSRRPSSSSTRIRAAPRPATSPADAYVRARDADSLAAFGGIVALNRPLDVADGRGDRVDVHRGGDRAVGRRRRRAPILARKTNMRVVTADFAALTRGASSFAVDSRRDARRRSATSSSEARQPWSAASLPDGLRVVTKRQPTAGGMGGAALCLAHLRAREVEHGDLHRRAAGRSRSAPAR